MDARDPGMTETRLSVYQPSLVSILIQPCFQPLA